MDPIENDAKKISRLARARRVDIADWLTLYLQRKKCWPSMGSLNDVNVSPGLHLIQLIHHVSEKDTARGREVAERFGDAAQMLLFRIQNGECSEQEQKDDGYITDLCCILSTFPAPDPAAAVALLCAIKDTRPFSIKSGRILVRREIYKALVFQLGHVENPASYEWTIWTVGPDVKIVDTCAQALSIMLLIDPIMAFVEIKDAVALFRSHKRPLEELVEPFIARIIGDEILWRRFWPMVEVIPNPMEIYEISSVFRERYEAEAAHA